MTNYEKMMSEMTVEKMAELFNKANCYKCKNCPVEKCEFSKTCYENIKEWLESEVSEND